jgi:regulator of PEP synthase PpsR (kinase-PPPase family)
MLDKKRRRASAPHGKEKGPPETKRVPVYVVSGGAGSSGSWLVNTVAAQFPDADIAVETIAPVNSVDRIRGIAGKAKETGGIIVHTRVDTRLREEMQKIAAAESIPAVDLMGELLDTLARILGRRPVGRPGLYRSLNRQYFDRFDSINFALTHDDGLNAGDLDQAEIVIMGVSRAGKTPISMYLAMLGWKVANVPYVQGQTPPPELKKADRGRMIGLNVDAEHLVSYRKSRRRKLGMKDQVNYTDLMRVFEEVEEAFDFYRRNGFTVIDVTDKPMETSADEILEIITARFGPKQDRPDSPAGGQ